MITAFNRCSISSFDSDKSEKAISKWTLARKMAAKVFFNIRSQKL